jgi:hypothetical protein
MVVADRRAVDAGLKSSHCRQTSASQSLSRVVRVLRFAAPEELRAPLLRTRAFECPCQDAIVVASGRWRI